MFCLFQVFNKFPSGCHSGHAADLCGSESGELCGGMETMGLLTLWRIWYIIFLHLWIMKNYIYMFFSLELEIPIFIKNWCVTVVSKLKIHSLCKILLSKIEPWHVRISSRTILPESSRKLNKLRREFLPHSQEAWPRVQWDTHTASLTLPFAYTSCYSATYILETRTLRICGIRESINEEYLPCCPLHRIFMSNSSFHQVDGRCYGNLAP